MYPHGEVLEVILSEDAIQVLIADKQYAKVIKIERVIFMMLYFEDLGDGEIILFFIFFYAIRLLFNVLQYSCVELIVVFAVPHFNMYNLADFGNYIENYINQLSPKSSPSSSNMSYSSCISMSSDSRPDSSIMSTLSSKTNSYPLYS